MKREREKKMSQSSKVKPMRQIKIGPGNIVSQIFFLWVFLFIFVLRRTKDIKELAISLRKKDTCRFNDDNLEKNWSREKERASKENR